MNPSVKPCSVRLDSGEVVDYFSPLHGCYIYYSREQTKNTSSIKNQYAHEDFTEGVDSCVRSIVPEEDEISSSDDLPEDTDLTSSDVIDHRHGHCSSSVSINTSDSFSTKVQESQVQEEDDDCFDVKSVTSEDWNSWFMESPDKSVPSLSSTEELISQNSTLELDSLKIVEPRKKVSNTNALKCENSQTNLNFPKTKSKSSKNVSIKSLEYKKSPENGCSAMVKEIDKNTLETNPVNPKVRVHVLSLSKNSPKNSDGTVSVKSPKLTLNNNDCSNKKQSPSKSSMSTNSQPPTKNKNLYSVAKPTQSTFDTNKKDKSSESKNSQALSKNKYSDSLVIEKIPKSTPKNNDSHCKVDSSLSKNSQTSAKFKNSDSLVIEKIPKSTHKINNSNCKVESSISKNSQPPTKNKNSGSAVKPTQSTLDTNKKYKLTENKSLLAPSKNKYSDGLVIEKIPKSTHKIDDSNFKGEFSSKSTNSQPPTENKIFDSLVIEKIPKSTLQINDSNCKVVSSLKSTNSQPPTKNKNSDSVVKPTQSAFHTTKKYKANDSKNSQSPSKNKYSDGLVIEKIPKSTQKITEGESSLKSKTQPSTKNKNSDSIVKPTQSAHDTNKKDLPTESKNSQAPSKNKYSDGLVIEKIPKSTLKINEDESSLKLKTQPPTKNKNSDSIVKPTQSAHDTNKKDQPTESKNSQSTSNKYADGLGIEKISTNEINDSYCKVESSSKSTNSQPITKNKNSDTAVESTQSTLDINKEGQSAESKNSPALSNHKYSDGLVIENIPTSSLKSSDFNFNGESSSQSTNSQNLTENKNSDIPEVETSPKLVHQTIVSKQIVESPLKSAESKNSHASLKNKDSDSPERPPISALNANKKEKLTDSKNSQSASKSKVSDDLLITKTKSNTDCADHVTAVTLSPKCENLLESSTIAHTGEKTSKESSKMCYINTPKSIPSVKTSSKNYDSKILKKKLDLISKKSKREELKISGCTNSASIFEKSVVSSNTKFAKSPDLQVLSDFTRKVSRHTYASNFKRKNKMILLISKSQTFDCSECAKTFGTKSTLRKHLILRHVDMKCSTCGFIFKGTKNFKLHSKKCTRSQIIKSESNSSKGGSPMNNIIVNLAKFHTVISVHDTNNLKDTPSSSTSASISEPQQFSITKPPLNITQKQDASSSKLPIANNLSPKLKLSSQKLTKLRPIQRNSKLQFATKSVPNFRAVAPLPNQPVSLLRVSHCKNIKNTSSPVSAQTCLIPTPKVDDPTKFQIILPPVNEEKEMKIPDPEVEKVKTKTNDLYSRLAKLSATAGIQIQRVQNSQVVADIKEKSDFKAPQRQQAVAICKPIPAKSRKHLFNLKTLTQKCKELETISINNFFPFENNKPAEDRKTAETVADVFSQKAENFITGKNSNVNCEQRREWSRDLKLFESILELKEVEDNVLNIPKSLRRIFDDKCDEESPKVVVESIQALIPLSEDLSGKEAETLGETSDGYKEISSEDINSDQEPVQVHNSQIEVEICTEEMEHSEIVAPVSKKDSTPEDCLVSESVVDECSEVEKEEPEVDLKPGCDISTLNQLLEQGQIFMLTEENLEQLKNDGVDILIHDESETANSEIIFDHSNTSETSEKSLSTVIKSKKCPKLKRTSLKLVKKQKGTIAKSIQIERNEISNSNPQQVLPDSPLDKIELSENSLNEDSMKQKNIISLVSDESPPITEHSEDNKISSQIENEKSSKLVETVSLIDQETDKNSSLSGYSNDIDSDESPPITEHSVDNEILSQIENEKSSKIVETVSLTDQETDKNASLSRYSKDIDSDESPPIAEHSEDNEISSQVENEKSSKLVETVSLTDQETDKNSSLSGYSEDIDHGISPHSKSLNCEKSSKSLESHLPDLETATLASQETDKSPSKSGHSRDADLENLKQLESLKCKKICKLVLNRLPDHKITAIQKTDKNSSMSKCSRDQKSPQPNTKCENLSEILENSDHELSGKCKPSEKPKVLTKTRKKYQRRKVLPKTLLTEESNNFESDSETSRTYALRQRASDKTTSIETKLLNSNNTKLLAKGPNGKCNNAEILKRKNFEGKNLANKKQKLLKSSPIEEDFLSPKSSKNSLITSKTSRKGCKKNNENEKIANNVMNITTNSRKSQEITSPVQNDNITCLTFNKNKKVLSTQINSNQKKKVKKKKAESWWHDNTDFEVDISSQNDCISSKRSLPRKCKELDKLKYNTDFKNSFSDDSSEESPVVRRTYRDQLRNGVSKKQDVSESSDNSSESDSDSFVAKTKQLKSSYLHAATDSSSEIESDKIVAKIKPSKSSDLPVASDSSSESESDKIVAKTKPSKSFDLHAAKDSSSERESDKIVAKTKEFKTSDQPAKKSQVFDHLLDQMLQVDAAPEMNKSQNQHYESEADSDDSDKSYVSDVESDWSSSTVPYISKAETVQMQTQAETVQTQTVNDEMDVDPLGPLEVVISDSEDDDSGTVAKTDEDQGPTLENSNFKNAEEAQFVLLEEAKLSEDSESDVTELNEENDSSDEMWPLNVCSVELNQSTVLNSTTNLENIETGPIKEKSTSIPSLLRSCLSSLNYNNSSKKSNKLPKHVNKISAFKTRKTHLQSNKNLKSIMAQAAVRKAKKKVIKVTSLAQTQELNSTRCKVSRTLFNSRHRSKKRHLTIMSSVPNSVKRLKLNENINSNSKNSSKDTFSLKLKIVDSETKSENSSNVNLSESESSSKASNIFQDFDMKACKVLLNSKEVLSYLKQDKDLRKPSLKTNKDAAFEETTSFPDISDSIPNSLDSSSSTRCSAQT